MRKAIPILILCLLEIGCSPIENKARDTAAALQGAIIAAQTQHQQDCAANPSAPVCGLINRAIAGQNALITSVEAYCGWSAANPPADPSAKCVPVKGATAGLNTAIANATEFIAELKGAIQ